MHTGGNIGPYRLEEPVGGEGDVWIARHETLDRRVAVRFFEARESEGFVERARALARLEGRHVAQVVDSGVAEGRPYLMTGVAEGHDLATRLRRHGPLDPRDAIAAGQAVLEVLGEMHATGLAHGRLTPAGVWLAPGAVTVERVDVAVAAQRGGAGPAPEQRGRGAARPASDVFAFGALMYAALGGQPAGGRPSLRSQLPLAGIPAALDELVADCLADDPAARPSLDAARARLSAAEEALDGGGVEWRLDASIGPSDGEAGGGWGLVTGGDDERPLAAGAAVELGGGDGGLELDLDRASDATRARVVSTADGSSSEGPTSAAAIGGPGLALGDGLDLSKPADALGSAAGSSRGGSTASGLSLDHGAGDLGLGGEASTPGGPRRPGRAVPAAAADAPLELDTGRRGVSGADAGWGVAPPPTADAGSPPSAPAGDDGAGWGGGLELAFEPASRRAPVDPPSPPKRPAADDASAPEEASTSEPPSPAPQGPYAPGMRSARLVQTPPWQERYRAGLVASGLVVAVLAVAWLVRGPMVGALGVEEAPLAVADAEPDRGPRRLDIGPTPQLVDRGLGPAPALVRSGPLGDPGNDEVPTVLIIPDPAPATFVRLDDDTVLCEEAEVCRVPVDGDVSVRKGGYRALKLAEDDLYDRRGGRWRVVLRRR